ncbi:MAG: heavy-metal-associated domain-containing protein [Planctomycetota bacterium]
MPPAPARRRLPIRVRVIAVGLLALGLFEGQRAWRAAVRAPAADAPRVEFDVEGLDCPVWCAVRLTENFDDLDGARIESIDQQHGRVVVRHDPARQDLAALRALLQRHGFPVQDSRTLPRAESAR